MQQFVCVFYIWPRFGEEIVERLVFGVVFTCKCRRNQTETTIAKLYIYNICGKINLNFNFSGVIYYLILLFWFFVHNFKSVNYWACFLEL